MKKLFYIVILIVAGGLGFLLWQKFFPKEEERIRRIMVAVAELATFPADEHRLMGVANANRLADRFTADAEFAVEVRGVGGRTFQGRDELLQAALAARVNIKGMKVEFLDILVTLGSDGETAMAELTAKVTMAGNQDFGVQELKASLRKVEDQWLIARVQTVDTLSM